MNLGGDILLVSAADVPAGRTCGDSGAARAGAALVTTFCTILETGDVFVPCAMAPGLPGMSIIAGNRADASTAIRLGLPSAADGADVGIFALVAYRARVGHAAGGGSIRCDSASRH